MASTEPRTGFRLPWVGTATATTEPETSADQTTSPVVEPVDPVAEAMAGSEQAGAQVAETDAREATAEASSDAPAEPEAVVEPEASFEHETAPQAGPAPEREAPPEVEPVVRHVVMGSGASDPNPWGPVPARPAASAPAPVAPSIARPPTRLMADLVRAMRSTAETSRAALIEGLHIDGKASIERIHARSAEEVNGLRRVSDEDVTGIKDWSKAEIARIRAETEERIAERKLELELSLEEHAALIEREVEHIQARIAEYEAEMDVFFVRLGEIDDPGEFAAIAAEMPEPPSLEQASAAARAAALDELARSTRAARVTETKPVEAVAEPVAEAVAEPEPTAEAVAEPTTEPVAEAVAEPEPTAEAVAEPTTEPVAEAVTAADPAAEAVTEAEPVAEPPTELVTEPVEAVAEPEPAAEAVAEPVAEPEPAAEAAAEPVAEPEPAAERSSFVESGTADPRLAALGLTPDAPTAVGVADADLEPGSRADIDALSEATIVARLGDAPSNGSSAQGNGSATPESATSVVVVGLVSVASVASFKRTLAKVAGIRSVGVSSGPEGEFIFKTVHDVDVTLRDIIPTLPGFGARVVSAGDGVVNVSARDPESDA